MAIWRVAAPRPAGVDAPTSPTAARPSSPATAPPARTPSTPTSSRPAATAPRSARTSYADEMRAPGAAATAASGRRSPPHITDPEQVNYTWFDRHAGRGLLAPRPGRAPRRRRPLLPAHPRPGRGHVPGGRPGPRRAADRPDDLGRRALHRRTTTAGIPRVRTVVEASVQIGQWQLDGVRDADVPGLMRPHHERAEGTPVTDLTDPAPTASTSTPTSCFRRSRRPSPVSPVSPRPRSLDARRNGPAALAVNGPMVGARMPRLTDVDRAAGGHGRGRRGRAAGQPLAVPLPLLGRRPDWPSGCAGWPTRARPHTAPRPPTGCTASGWSPSSTPTSPSRCSTTPWTRA